MNEQAEIGGMSSPQRDPITETPELSNVVNVDTKEPMDIYEETCAQGFDNPKFKLLDIQRIGLKYGDFSFNSLGAERKTVSDFLGSIHDNRLSDQARNMFDNYEYCYLLVSGDLGGFESRDWKAIYTKCADVEFRYGFKVMFFPTDEMLIHYFLMLCYKLSSKLKPKSTFKINNPTGSDEQVNVLRGFRGCGKKTGIKLLKKHGDLNTIFNLPEPKKGVLHKHMYEIINKEFDESEID